MAAAPEYFIYTSTGGIIRLHDATPANICGLATIGLAPCMGLVIAGTNGRISLLHTPRLGMDWPSIISEVDYVGAANIERVYIVYNPWHINEEDQGYLDLFNYFAGEIRAPVQPFQVTEIFLGRIAYNRYTRTMETPTDDNLRSENSILYSNIFSLNKYFDEITRLYLHYDGQQWATRGPTLHPYLLQIYQQNIHIFNEDAEAGRIQIRNAILRDAYSRSNGIPDIFCEKLTRLQQVNPQALEAALNDIGKCIFIYAREIPRIPQLVPAQVNIGQNPNILLTPPRSNIRNEDLAANQIRSLQQH